jgi:hypothetical protein
MKRVLSILAACAALCAAAFAQTDVPQAPQVPDEVLVAVEIAQPGVFEQQARAFAQAAGLGQAADRINLDDLARTAAWDRAKPLRVLVLRGEPGKTAVAMVFAVQDAAAFQNAMAAKFVKKDTADGVTTFVQERRQFDLEAFRKAQEEGGQRPPNMEDFQKTVEVPVYVAVEGATVCLGNEPAGVAAARKLLLAGRLTDQPLIGRLHYLEVFVRPKALVEQTGADLEPAPPAEPGTDAATLALGQLKTLAPAAMQVQGAFISIRVSAERVIATVRLYAVPGTPLAKYLQSVPAGVPHMLEQLPADAMIWAGFRAGDLSGIMPLIMEMGKAGRASMGMELTEVQQKLAQEAVGLYGNDAAFSLSSLLPLNMTTAFRLRNEEAGPATREMMAQGAKANNEIAKAAGTPLRIEVTRAVETHNGVEIDEFAYKVDASAAPQPTGLARKQAAALTQFFGDGFRAHSAIRGDTMLTSMGKDGSQARLKAMLDGTQAGLADSQRYKDIIAALPREPQGVMYVGLASLLKTVYDAQLAKLPPDVAQQAAALKVEPGPGLYGGMRAGGDDAALVIILPADEARAAIQAAQGLFALQMMIKAMQQGNEDAGQDNNGKVDFQDPKLEGE